MREHKGPRAGCGRGGPPAEEGTPPQADPGPGVVTWRDADAGPTEPSPELRSDYAEVTGAGSSFRPSDRGEPSEAVLTGPRVSSGAVGRAGRPGAGCVGEDALRLSFLLNPLFRGSLVSPSFTQGKVPCRGARVTRWCPEGETTVLFASGPLPCSRGRRSTRAAGADPCSPRRPPEQRAARPAPPFLSPARTWQPRSDPACRAAGLFHPAIPPWPAGCPQGLSLL